jgi:hypothetical protein
MIPYYLPKQRLYYSSYDYMIYSLVSTILKPCQEIDDSVAIDFVNYVRRLRVPVLEISKGDYREVLRLLSQCQRVPTE